MNTTEVKYNGEIDSFKTLFKMAKKQFLTYEKIEGIPNWKDYDFSIDCSEDQMKFKDMLQIRFIEELTEASVSMREMDESHFWEEIGDSLNFFLSAYIMLGQDLNKLPSPENFIYKGWWFIKSKPSSLKSFSKLVYPIIEDVGSLCNLLKNRPWTQSNFLVSMEDFNERLLILWENYWKMLGKLYLTKEDIFEMFFKKVKVNEFRMQTGY